MKCSEITEIEREYRNKYKRLKRRLRKIEAKEHLTAADWGEAEKIDTDLFNALVYLF